MKNSKPAPNSNRERKSIPQFNVKKHRPDNKDNLDSREDEEQLFKKDDVTHNKKETKSEKNKKTG